MTDLQIASSLDTVTDVMTTWVVTITPNESLLKARDLMTHNRVSQIVVVDEKTRPTGLLSKRDIARFLLEDPTTRQLDEMLVYEAASESIRTLRSDLPIFNAARMFDTENLSCAVITDERPVAGIMTETDLSHYFAQRFPDKFKVDELMTRDFVFAKTIYPIVHVANDIVYRQPSVPVIDEELVGIVTLSDLLSLKEKAPAHWTVSFKSGADESAALITAKDLMTRNPVTTEHETDLAQAAQIIINKGVSSLPVVEQESHVIGLLTKHDVVRALGRIGRALTTEI